MKGVSKMKKVVKVLSSTGLALLLVLSFASSATASCESSPTITSRRGQCESPYTCRISGGSASPYYVVYTEGYYRCWTSSGVEYREPYSSTSNQGCC